MHLRVRGTTRRPTGRPGSAAEGAVFPFAIILFALAMILFAFAMIVAFSQYASPRDSGDNHGSF
jgi:hypothetical protein